MKYEDRIQLKVDELTTAFFDHVIAYYLSKPSGLGGPGCVYGIRRRKVLSVSWT